MTATVLTLAQLKRFEDGQIVIEYRHDLARSRIVRIKEKNGRFIVKSDDRAIQSGTLETIDDDAWQPSSIGPNHPFMLPATVEEAWDNILFLRGEVRNGSVRCRLSLA